MVNFLTFTGILFWVIFNFVLILWGWFSILEHFRNRKKKKIEKIENQAYKDIGICLYSLAYWFSGDEYKDVHPYVLLKTIGQDIKTIGWPVISSEKRQKMLEDSKLMEKK